MEIDYFKQINFVLMPLVLVLFNSKVFFIKKAHWVTWYFVVTVNVFPESNEWNGLFTRVNMLRMIKLILSNQGKLILNFQIYPPSLKDKVYTCKL